MNTTNLNRKLPLRVKLCYAIGNFGNYSLLILNAAFLLYFYTDVVNISPGAATIIILISKLWDAINDPMMGVLLDRTKSREGKCRAFLKWFSIPAGICVFLSYYVPGFLESGKAIWVAVTYILQSMAQTVLSVPFNTLLARLSQDRIEIAKLGQFSSAGTILANLVVPAITLPLARLVAGDNLRVGFAVVAILYGALVALCHLAAYFGTKGYEQSDDELISAGVTQQASNVKILDMLKALAQNKLCLMLVGGYALYCVYSALMGGSLLYYLIYNLKNENLMSLYSVLSTVTGFAPVIFIVFFVKKFGTAGTAMISCAVVALGEIIRFITSDGSIYFLGFGWCMEGIGLALFSTMIRQSMVDAMTYGEWKTGVSNQGILMSSLTFAQKLGQAVGGVGAAALLELFGYVANAPDQTELVKQVFFAEQVILPLVIFIILVAIFGVVRKYEKHIPEMKAEIEARKNIGSGAEIGL